MPANSEPLPTDTREHFCCALKAARESKGISLDEIEKATKIPAYLFAALERCDLKRWPHGLFRRSFFRDYARTIGLPVTEACAAFVQLFVDEEDVVVALQSPEVQGGSKEVQGGSGGAAEVRGDSVLPRLRDALVSTWRQGAGALVTAWRQGARGLSRIFERMDRGAAEPEPERHDREWVSDARRVSSEAPRFRVRIRIQR
jgi:hypothetical protein